MQECQRQSHPGPAAPLTWGKLGVSSRMDGATSFLDQVPMTPPPYLYSYTHHTSFLGSSVTTGDMKASGRVLSSQGPHLHGACVSGCAKSLQSCPTLCDPMDCSLPGSSVHGIFQERILKWIAISSSRGSSPPRDQIQVSYISCIGRLVLYH